MENVTFDSLITHITERAGLRVRDNERGEWERVIQSRMATHHLTRPSQYLKLLRSDALDSDDEWRWLLPLLTNGESYFMRDQGQMSLLRHRLIPELVERRKSQRSLRLWSAGCSTGEEPYSLALLVQEIVPPDWDVLIFGTDINEDALKKARHGVYGSWSFRALSYELRERCFRPVADGYELDPHLRRMVRFERDNLSGEASSRSTREMDLILCRNVLIYFRPEAVKRVVARFAESLREGGYLLTGHAELHHHNVSPLQARAFPESTVYERRDHEPAAPKRAISRTVTIPTPSPRTHSKKFNAKQRTPKALPVVQAIESATNNLISTKNEVESLCEAARRYANAGRHHEAIFCCQQAIALDPVAAQAYLVWAQVALEQEDLETAKNLFKKVIYLDPLLADASLGLAVLYEKEGNAARARRARTTALSLMNATEGDLNPSASNSDRGQRE